MTRVQGMYTDIHRDIIERCRKNDRKAQLELYRLYSNSVFNTCFRILKDSGKAEDAAQESFITAFEKLSSFKGESTFGAWIKRIAIHKSIDELRKINVKFDDVDESNEAAYLETTEPELNESGFSNETTIQKIKEALFLMPEGYRVVLSLYLLEGYDHEEIAQILKIGESTSRSQYTRAKQKLTELLIQKFGFSYAQK